jgi:uncharacterized caspase-like protein
MQAPRGTLISYATQPGNVALDGATGHSPYTAALADAIRKPGAPVLQGAVSADGSFTGQHGTQPMTGRFQIETFEASYPSTNASCGQRTVTLRHESPH